MAGVFIYYRNLIFASYMRMSILGLVIGCAAAACEKDVSVALQHRADELVVEGKIENGGYPQVILTRSLDYFSRISPEQLQQSFVHDAKVTVSNGNRTMQLQEYAIDTAGVRLYVYTVNMAQLATAFRGRLNQQYTLKITVGGKSYQAVTTIPPIGLVIDSMWWNKAKVEKDSSYARLQVRVTDPPERGNYVRYFTKRNSEPFLPGLNSVVDDQIVNGTTFDIPVDAGVNKNDKLDFDTYGFFRRGDTVTLKFCNIDKATYDFWRTLDFAYSSNGNPFSSPTLIQNNIPGALGYWGGYAVTLKSIIIPD